MRLQTLTCVALLAAAPALAQDEGARRVATEVAARVPLERAIKGAPYSAETVIDSSQQLADGNRIARKTTGRVYRDSEGRTRREEDRPNGSVMVSISDPIAGFTYSLDAVSKVAWRTPRATAGAIMNKIEGAEAAVTTRVEPVRTPSPDGTTVSNRVTSIERTRGELEKIEAAKVAGAGQGGGAVAPVPAGGRGGAGGFGGVTLPRTRGVSAGPLEHRTIEGVAVEGRKTTTVIPAGQVGNEQPITIVSEQWSSPDLNVLVLTRHSDPRSGESSYRLLNIVRAEPDRSLFMVPADYTVRDTAVRRMLDSRK